MATMVDRMKRAVMLDATLYAEVEENANLNKEALLIVVMVSVAGGLGALIGGLIGGEIGGALLSALVTVVMGVVNYYIWAYVTYFVGTRFFGGTADPGEMLRVLGYAHTPQLLSLLSFIPCVGPIISLAAMVLSLIATVIALREALDFDTGKAIITGVIGWVIIVVITMIVGTVFLGGAIGLGALSSMGG